MLANGSQNSLLIAATGNALTTVFAGFAFTTTSFPNITFLPAFVAGFFRVFTMQRPGSVNFPSPFNSCVAIPPREPMTLEHSLFFRPVSLASASARAPFVIGILGWAKRVQNSKSFQWLEPKWLRTPPAT
mmetsp:Transcript_1516/g.927  ORF Transcript_1516/g.927 Transcript_1516/m.927 type:complete len:130 (-) Transcript_1516:33-422(-)